MIFSKYLFTTIAGLTGGVNAWAFSSSGGAIIDKDLKNFNSELSTTDSSKTDLILKENKRLQNERETSEKSFQALESQNSATKEKSRRRRSAGTDLSKKNHDLELTQRKNTKTLNDKKDQLQQRLSEDTKNAKQQVEQKVQSFFSSVKSAVDLENSKLSQALQSLQESNKKLIEKVRDCIQELPQSIFVEQSELKNKSYCDYVAEKKQKEIKSS